ncbi:hypothetical protein ACH5RR_030230 [Cinchona calisaya]|uniref:Uncharacterized protein n=1 Tax=Cinchona calisaya TaxID=153742 RepID=A0ABD2YVE0_9GENT
METAVGSAVGFLLENLLQLIKENQDLIRDAGSKVTKLSDNIELLKSVVTRYTEKHFENETLSTLAKQIRSLIHEAEDAIEEYVYYVALHRGKGTLDKARGILSHNTNVRAVSRKIEDISERVNEMYIMNYVIGEEAFRMEQFESVKARGKKPKPGVGGKDKVIGFQDAAIEVIQCLTGKKLDQQTIPEAEKHETELKQETEEEQKNDLEQKTEFEELEVVSIVGMLGLGKTTLARKVLSDPVIEYEFFTRIFVAVSQDYDKKEVLQTILLQGNFFENVTELNGKSIDDLVKLIDENLKNKYLVVLDDVWTNDVWKDLKGVFPDNKKGSRVLITTRNNSVAECSRSKIKPYDLRFLYAEESRELLRTKVFDENRCPEHLEEIETNILDKCKGLPLAIVVTAGILRNTRENKEWWDKVSRGVSLRNLKDDGQKQSDMLIKMSYDHLPYELKPCFLYLGVFPEDVEIPVWRLLRLWIAEGFIQQAPETTLEEIAEDYLRELVDRNLVMVGKRRSNDQIKTCRVHDTLRYFCKKMAIEENLFQDTKSSDKASGSSAISSIENSRRLCVNPFFEDYIPTDTAAPRVRSFLSFSKDEKTLQKDVCSNIVKPFRLLKVLDIKSIKLVGRFPAGLSTLVLLKYIAMNTEFKILPKKMSSLSNLQTIIMDTFYSTLEIQLELCKMTQLRHIHTNASTTLPKCQEQSLMVNLQTFSTISPDSCTPEFFATTKNLKKLGIRGKLGPIVQMNGESSLFDSLLRLELLENLKLHNDDVTCKLKALPLEYKFPA